MNTRRPSSSQPRRRPSGPPTRAGRWLPAAAAAGVLALVVLAGVSGRGDSSSPSGGTEPASGVVDTGLTVPQSTLAPVVIVTDPGQVKTQLGQTLSKGMVNSDVTAVQQRLTDLAFSPGPIDGVFGSGTQQAVWAFEKYVMRVPRAEATGRVTNEMWQLMQDPITIQPRRVTGAGSTHMEIYLPEQVAIVFTDDKPVLITHISSGLLDENGQPKTFCETAKIDTDDQGNKLDPPQEKAICAEAKTPGGVFKFYRRYEGKRVSALGGMTNPVYFNFGIAVHGAENVPLAPASHGCIRINQRIAVFFPSLVRNGDRVYVWGEDGKEPEQYSKRESLPSFNRPDPNATTTTSSTSTTSTTVAPTTTTISPPTTTKPPTSTTSTTITSTTTTTTTLP